MSGERAFGRIEKLDARDHAFLMSAELPIAVPLKGKKTWRRGPQLDQGATSSCVGQAWLGWLNCEPMRTLKNVPTAIELYQRAQVLDGIEPEGYDGTTIRGGAEAVLELERMESYLWDYSVDGVARWLLARGPVVFGTAWYRGMMQPDEQGYIKPDGPIVGGHGYLVCHVDVKRERFGLPNSWGEDWNGGKLAWLSFEDASRLLHEGGEACTAIEVKPKKK